MHFSHPFAQGRHSSDESLIEFETLTTKVNLSKHYNLYPFSQIAKLLGHGVHFPTELRMNPLWHIRQVELDEQIEHGYVQGEQI